MALGLEPLEPLREEGEEVNSHRLGSLRKEESSDLGEGRILVGVEGLLRVAQDVVASLLQRRVLGAVALLLGPRAVVAAAVDFDDEAAAGSRPAGR